jgi:hypothetical protein
MSVWFAIPSIREGGGTIPLWRKQGYNVAVLRMGNILPDVQWQVLVGDYKGWAPSVNWLTKDILERDPKAEWIVTGGDDYEPDMRYSAEQIGQSCSLYFQALRGYRFGVMQPTGDRWGDTEMARKQYGENRGAYIDRIAGSPWFSRSWCQLAYQGNGPMFAGYKHMYADEELKEVAEAMGVYWPRRDLTQLHKHWGRRPGDQFADFADCPDFLHQVNTPQHWHESKALFDARKLAGWPGAGIL